MKSVLLRARPGGGLEARPTEVPVPTLGPGELLVEMKACGLCGTDIEKVRGHYTSAMPILGHEAVGVVADVGRDVEEFKEGDRVFPHHHVADHDCYYCARGNETMCDRYKTSNIDPGGFSEFFRVPGWNLSKGGVLRIPDSLAFEEASLIEPVACCIRALERSGVEGADFVLVIGAGPVGMAHAMILRSRGSQVAISDVSEARLGFADRAGFQVVIDASKRDIAVETKEVSAGRGADKVVLATGNRAAIAQAFKSVRKGGTVCIFGLPPEGTVLDYDFGKVFTSEVNVVSSYGATEKETTEAMELLASGKAGLGTLVTDRFPLRDFEKGMDVAANGKGMKVVITP